LKSNGKENPGWKPNNITIKICCSKIRIAIFVGDAMSLSALTQNTHTNLPTLACAECPVVSIIIPNYNHGQYITDAIDSVLSQSYHKFEIIVVDDGSTDNSREIVAQYGDKVNYIWQENQGLSAARNTGILAARGELIGLLDADDLLEPDFLSTLVSVLSETPNADAVYCSAQFVDANNISLPQKTCEVVSPDQLYETLLDGGFFPPLCMLAYKYCYIQEGMFDIAFQGCADWDMWLKISKKFTVIGLSIPLARYRILPKSMSSDPQYMLNDRLAVIEKHLGHLSSYSKQRAYGRSYLTSTTEYLQYGDEHKANYYFQKMVNADAGLLTQQNTFYELGCGDQPKGQRGNLTALNLEHNTQVLERLLDKLFSDESFGYLQDQKNEIYANAYFTLGLIAYNKSDMTSCRRYLIKALSFRPNIRYVRRIGFLYLKSLLGRASINYLRIIVKTSATTSS
jgi:glycosyltransferase involved in cell wall biosynthesis